MVGLSRDLDKKRSQKTTAILFLIVPKVKIEENR